MLQQRIQIDIDLARGSDVTDFEAVGLKTVLDHTGLLDADQFLSRIRDDKTC